MPAVADGIASAVPFEPGFAAGAVPLTGKFGLCIVESASFVATLTFVTHSIGRAIIIVIMVADEVRLEFVVFIPISIFRRGIDPFRHRVTGRGSGDGTYQSANGGSDRTSDRTDCRTGSSATKSPHAGSDRMAAGLTSNWVTICIFR